MAFLSTPSPAIKSWRFSASVSVGVTVGVGTRLGVEVTVEVTVEVEMTVEVAMGVARGEAWIPVASSSIITITGEKSSLLNKTLAIVYSSAKIVKLDIEPESSVEHFRSELVFE